MPTKKNLGYTPHRNGAGYTLVELLVVISILAVLGVFVIVNFKNFAQDQVINKSIGQMQSVLRLAQSNATSGAFCLIGCPNPNLACGDWWAEFSAGGSQINLFCAKSTSVQKIFFSLIDSVVPPCVF